MSFIYSIFFFAILFYLKLFILTIFAFFRAFLRDVVETANIFIKMMEKFCKDSVVVQDKKRSKKRSNKKSKKSDKPQQETEVS